jgi:uncharacterized BrkB/YihY/UPF0761 family membrane protein
LDTPLHKIWLLLRTIVPLAAVALAVLAGPALLTWWLLGGPFGWRHVLIGGAISLALLIGGALLFGWAIGRMPK